MRVAIASDHAGFEQKQLLAAYLAEDLAQDVLDLGPDSDDRVDYPDFANKVAHAVADGDAEYGVLVCGTGIGMSMAANKVKGIRAACCSDTYSAKYTRLHNDANVLCMGARVVGEGLAYEIAKVFLETEFEGGKHLRRINMISDLENK